jgi:hypothetical protein
MDPCFRIRRGTVDDIHFMVQLQLVLGVFAGAGDCSVAVPRYQITFSPISNRGLRI